MAYVTDTDGNVFFFLNVGCIRRDFIKQELLCETLHIRTKCI